MSSGCNHDHGWGEVSFAFAFTGILIFLVACINVMGIDIGGFVHESPNVLEKTPRLFGNSIEDWYLIGGVILISIFCKIMDIKHRKKHHHHD